MNILLIFNHYAVSSGRYMTGAFKRLGHSVRHIGPAHGRNIWGITVDAKYVHEPDELDGIWTSDITIVMDSDAMILNGFYHWVGKEPVIVYGVDNHVRDYRRPWFDHYFLAHHDGQGQPVRYPDETWLPCAYDPVHFTPSPIPYAERAYDVCMIGVMYAQRWHLVNALKEAGLKVYAGTGLLYDEYREAYHNARISLCVSANGDVAQRVFETAAMGCLVVSDECADFERLRPKGIVVHSHKETMVDLIGNLARLPKENSDQILKDSLEWVRPHTWDARAQTIIDWYEKQQAGEAFYATAE